MPLAFVNFTQVIQAHRAVLLNKSVVINHDAFAKAVSLLGNRMIRNGTEVYIWMPFSFCAVVVVIA
jgi:hypothetical protein